MIRVDVVSQLCFEPFLLKFSNTLLAKMFDFKSVRYSLPVV